MGEKNLPPHTHTLLWNFADKAEQGGLGDFTVDCKALMCEGSNQMLLFGLKQEMRSGTSASTEGCIQGPAAAPAGLSCCSQTADLTQSYQSPQLSFWAAFR